jgi:hypothetical protein
MQHAEATASTSPFMTRARFQIALPLAVLTGVFLCVVTGLQAKPDFAASEITASAEKVIEGGVARFTLTVRNRGDAPAEPAQVRLQWPVMGHVVEVAGVEGAQADPEARVTTAAFSLAPGGERALIVEVLAPRGSAGAALSLSAQVIHYSTMAETWVHKTIEIDSRPRTDGLHLGGWRIAPAGVVTLIWLVATVLAIGIAGRLPGGRAQGAFFGPGAGAGGIMIALGFWLIFAAMAWRDYRVLREWTPSTATIVGRRVETQSVSGSQRPRSGSGTSSGQENVSKPEFALRYLVDGRPTLSTGYDTGSSLRMGGGQAELEKEFREWTVGARVPCWYDPRNPEDVVIKRGFGGAYLFALLPLFPFWMGWSLLRRGVSNGG